MNVFFIFAIAGIVLLAIIVRRVLFPLLSIAVGFAAKSMCSGVFIAGRSHNHITQADLNFPPVKYTANQINFDDQSVTSTLLGVITRKAKFTPALGSSLLFPGKPKYPTNGKYHSHFIVNQPQKLPAFEDFVPKKDAINIDYDLLNKTINQAFDDPKSKSLQNTRALLVVHNNQLIAEQYAAGFEKNTPQLGWSITKSITNAMTGLLVKDGLLDIHEPTNLVQWQSDNRKNITINHLLQMTSGLQWKEG